MTDQITPEELKKFWEWCDLIYYADDTCWYTKDGRFAHDGKLTLDNLFKYAAPILEEHSSASGEYVMGKFCEAIYHHSLKPEVALLRDIQEAIR